MRRSIQERSHGFAVTDGLFAVCATVLLIVAGRDAEGDQAAAEPAAYETEHEAEDPAQCSFLLVHVCHAGLSA